MVETKPVYSKYRSDVLPGDKFAKKWITHPQVLEIDSENVLCDKCGKHVPRSNWERHLGGGCLPRNNPKGWFYEPVTSDDEKEAKQPPLNGRISTVTTCTTIVVS